MARAHSLLIGGKKVAACLHAHFPKCRQRRVPAAWSGDLSEEPVTFHGSLEDFREEVKAFGAKRKPRCRGNDAWRGDSRSLRGVAADGGPSSNPSPSSRESGANLKTTSKLRGLPLSTAVVYGGSPWAAAAESGAWRRHSRSQPGTLARSDRHPVANPVEREGSGSRRYRRRSGLARLVLRGRFGSAVLGAGRPFLLSLPGASQANFGVAIGDVGIRSFLSFLASLARSRSARSKR